MEHNKKIKLKRISAISCMVAFCVALFGSLFIPTKKVHADQIIDGDATLMLESNSMYRAFLPFDTVSSYEIVSTNTNIGGLDLNYFYRTGSTISVTSSTVPSYSLTATFLGNWGYLSFSNWLYFNTYSSWTSDFNVECIDSYWEVGGLSYTPYENVNFSMNDLTFSLSKPILVDPNSPDTTFTIVYSSYNSNVFCLKWTYKITYTLLYIDNNGEQQTVNITSSDTSYQSFQYGSLASIMPALPSDANLNYPYMLYNYNLRMIPYSPNGNVTTLNKNYALPLFRFNTYAYRTADYRFLEYEFYETDITVIDPVDNWVDAIKSFFFESVHGFLSVEILPGISFYWILFVCVGIPLLIAILKIWLGG